MDIQKIEEAVKNLILALGYDINSPELIKTSNRAAKMYAEMFEGTLYTNDEIAEKFNTTFNEQTSNDMVLIKDIGFFSFCEHHFALMYNMKAHIAYKPKDKIIGLSKVARIVRLVSKRFQLQERMGNDIVYILKQILQTDDIMVIIDGEHSCMTARGIKSEGSSTRTITASGVFLENPAEKQEVLLCI